MADPSQDAGPSTLPKATPANRQLTVNEQDESVMIAVRALDDMRSRPRFVPYQISTSSQPTPALSPASTATSPSIASHPFSSQETNTPDFVSRVSGFTLVDAAIRAYEQSKASSRVVKYGAEMMESSVKTISKPVIDRLPVNQLDEFACRQLDRLGVYGKVSQDAPTKDSLLRDSPQYSRGRQKETWETGLRMHTGEPFSDSSREGSLSRSDGSPPDREGITSQQQQDVAARSRWQALLLEAGGIGAAVSEESMRRLKYCIHWLQYATDHIDGQILVLRNFIASLSSHEASGERLVSASHLRILTDVKRDVVETIRQVVDVVSKYAGGALPEPARARVRQFILLLPHRWANTTQRQSQQANGTGAYMGLDSPPNMTALPSAGFSASGQRVAIRPTATAATQAAQRIMTLATESLDMLRSVNGVFKESLDRAEAWIERLRIVGVQRQIRQAGTNQEDPTAATFGTQVSQPPPTDAPWSGPSSPTGVTASSLGAMSLSSAYATPRSSNTSLPDLPDSDWCYRRDVIITDDIGEDERVAVSDIRGTVEPKMDLDT